MIFQSGHPAEINSWTRRSIYSEMLFDLVAIHISLCDKFSYEGLAPTEIKTYCYLKAPGGRTMRTALRFHQDCCPGKLLLCKSCIRQLVDEHFWRAKFVGDRRESNTNLPHILIENSGRSVSHSNIFERCACLVVRGCFDCPGHDLFE